MQPPPLTGILELRRYRPEDADATLSVFYEAVRRSARRDYTQDQVEAWAPNAMDWPGWKEGRSNRMTWVAERDGFVIGFTDLMPDGLIAMLFVHPDHEGQGIGSALLGEVEKVARELGLARLHTAASLTACRVFARARFKITASQTVELRGQTFMNFRMEKRLFSAAA